MFRMPLSSPSHKLRCLRNPSRLSFRPYRGSYAISCDKEGYDATSSDPYRTLRRSRALPLNGMTRSLTGLRSYIEPSDSYCSNTDRIAHRSPSRASSGQLLNWSPLIRPKRHSHRFPRPSHPDVSL